MSKTSTNLPVTESALLTTTIRDLVEGAPQTIEILAPLGLDLCCGGGHELGEALRLHNINAESVVPQLLATLGSIRSAD